MGPKHCGFVALIGEPNAGKSTLLNAIIGARLAIITHKTQTTRYAMRGITLHGQSQMIFVDTPGIFEPRRAQSRALDRYMVRAAWAGAHQADIVTLIIDANKAASAGTARIIVQLREQELRAPVFLVLNKIDKAGRSRLLSLSKTLNEQFSFSESFMISAKTGDGVSDLADALARALPEGEWLYPADQLADAPSRVIAAEITREKILLRLHDELPYSLFVAPHLWEERKDGSLRISQHIIIARKAHKPIILGKGGATIKAISQAAREAISEFLGRKTHLFLEVKIDENWSQEAQRLGNF